MPPKKKAPHKDHLSFMHEVAVFLEKSRLAEYMDLMQKPARLAWLSFWGGVWRGFGYGVGLVVLLAVFLWSLKIAYHHAGGLPWIGNEAEEAIGWLLNVIEKKAGQLMDRNARIIVTTALAALAGDLASKWLVQSRFALYESVHLAPGLALTYVMNPGAAFSMFASWPAIIRLPLFIAVTGGALWAAWHYWRGLPAGDSLSALALGLVAGGALGNLVDRIRYGQVVDFIEVGVRSVYTWPIFNVADSCVCVGVAFLIFRSFRPHASHPL